MPIPISINYPNGLFFRYTKKRLGVRALASYSKNSFSYNSSGDPDNMNGTENIKNFILGIGGQLSIFKKKDWLYTFLDAQYRNRYSSGFYIDYWNHSFTTSTNGLQTSLGIGLKFKIFKMIYISPEIACMVFYGHENYTVTSLMYYGVVTKDSDRGGDQNFVAKLHLTVKF